MKHMKMKHMITRDPKTGRICVMVETEEGGLVFGELLPYVSKVPDRSLQVKAVHAFNDLLTNEQLIIIAGK